MNNVAITGGQLVAAITCGLFSNVSQVITVFLNLYLLLVFMNVHLSTLLKGWRWMLGLAAVPSLVQLLGFLMMPETPRYLVTRNKMDEAERELSSLRGVHHDIRAEIEDIIISSRSGSNATWRSIISSRVARISISLGKKLLSNRVIKTSTRMGNLYQSSGRNPSTLKVDLSHFLFFLQDVFCKQLSSWPGSTPSCITQPLSWSWLAFQTQQASGLHHLHHRLTSSHVCLGSL